MPFPGGTWVGLSGVYGIDLSLEAEETSLTTLQEEPHEHEMEVNNPSPDKKEEDTKSDRQTNSV